MPQTLPSVPVDDVRARLDADPALVPDALLQSYITAAEQLVGPELDPETDYAAAGNVAEGIAQLAVKLYDMRARGVGDADLSGDFPAAQMPATSGLVRSVRGLLLPSMPAGGVTV